MLNEILNNQKFYGDPKLLQNAQYFIWDCVAPILLLCVVVTLLVYYAPKVLSKTTSKREANGDRKV